MTRSFGTTKQSPSPQHHSPAALRWPPREIQLSWAKVSEMTKARLAKTSANRARLPNMDTSLSLSRPGSRSSHVLIVSIECAGGVTRLPARGIPPAPFGPLASDFGTIASQSVHAESIRQAKPGRAQSADGVLSPLPVGPYGSALQRLPRFIRPENRTIEPRA